MFDQFIDSLKQLWFIILPILLWGIRQEIGLHSLKEKGDKTDNSVTQIEKQIGQIHLSLNEMLKNQQRLLTKDEDKDQNIQRLIDRVDRLVERQM